MENQAQETTRCDASLTATETACEYKPVEFGDLACELRRLITDMLVHPRDLAAARCASSLFAVGARIDDVVLRWASPCGMGGLLKSRAPLPLIAATLRNDTLDSKSFLLCAAASGGRVDVVRLVHREIEVRRPFPVPFSCTLFFAASKN